MHRLYYDQRIVADVNTLPQRATQPLRKASYSLPCSIPYSSSSSSMKSMDGVNAVKVGDAKYKCTPPSQLPRHQTTRAAIFETWLPPRAYVTRRGRDVTSSLITSQWPYHFRFAEWKKFHLLWLSGCPTNFNAPYE